ncbi:MAG: hypothetical protein ACRDTG_32865 [Pseudonocardiaceae bacterium]
MLALRELVEDDAVSPDEPPEEPPVELGLEFDVEPGFSPADFSELELSELDLSDVDLLSPPGWGLSDEPDSEGGAARLSVR